MRCFFRFFRIFIANITDNRYIILERKPSSTFRKRDPEKQLLLFKMAKKRKDRLFKKIGEREYELKKEGGTNER